MIHFTLTLAPSRHKRSAKAAMVEALRHYPAVRQLQKRRYKVRIELFGHWDQKNGDPRKRDADSVLIPLFDAIAEVSGVDDKWLCRDFSVKVTHAERESVVVQMQAI